MKYALLTLAVLISSCRTSQPPEISIICLGDGLGGANCKDPKGNVIHKLPSELENFWMTTPEDMAAFSAWCFKTNLNVTAPIVREMTTQMKESQRNEFTPH